VKIELIALDKAWAKDAMGEGSAWAQASCANYATVAPFLEDAIDALIAMYERAAEEPSWTAYLVRDVADHAFVGVCSLTKAPNGELVLGYHTFPPYQGKGYAKQMVTELAALAFRCFDVAEIVAHTPPQEGAAVAVLRALNFGCAKTVTDTDRGRRWQWALSRCEHREQTKPLFIPMVRAGVVSSLIARGFGR
jgi:[ribosomal protein S5]-alanine N-acetyltransferase